MKLFIARDSPDATVKLIAKAEKILKLEGQLPQ